MFLYEIFELIVRVIGCFVYWCDYEILFDIYDHCSVFFVVICDLVHA